MTTIVVRGNLLESDCTIIAHQANCFSTMGAGIAKSLRAKYPEAYRADKEFPYTPSNRLGRCSRIWSTDRTKVLVNLYGQFRYGREKRHTDYDAVRSALNEMFEGLKTLRSNRPDFPIKIGLPWHMGCANAGGDWNTVRSIIDECAEVHGFTVYLYQL